MKCSLDLRELDTALFSPHADANPNSLVCVGAAITSDLIGEGTRPKRLKDRALGPMEDWAGNDTAFEQRLSSSLFKQISV